MIVLVVAFAVVAPAVLLLFGVEILDRNARRSSWRPGYIRFDRPDARKRVTKPW